MTDLVQVMPRRPNRPALRSIWVPAPINAILTTPSDAIREDFPNALADALISSFTFGWSVSVSLQGDPDERKPDLERMVRVDEVWLLCFRKFKHNQWRLMGRFVKVATFVGLHLYRRGELAGLEYESNAFVFQTCWERSFGSAVLRGIHWTDYLTGSVKDVYESD